MPFLYRENGLTTFPVSSNGTRYFQVRSIATGLPQDTGNNENDFVLVSEGDSFGGILGAPGPENLSSPIQRNAQIKASYIDPASPASCTNPTLACARVRDTTSNPGNFSTFGMLSLRRRFTNNTGASVTRLRFRVVDITTLISSGTGVPAGTADLRVLSSSNITVTTAGGGTLDVQGLTREEPPVQPIGGGLNTSLSAGTVTLAQPLLPGAEPSTCTSSSVCSKRLLPLLCQRRGAGRRAHPPQAAASAAQVADAAAAPQALGAQHQLTTARRNSPPRRAAVAFLTLLARDVSIRLEQTW